MIGPLDSLEKIVYNEGNPCNQEGVLVPNPGDCGSFLICVHEKFIAQSCQSGLHFDNKIKACNFIQLAGCEPGEIHRHLLFRINFRSFIC